MIKKESKSILEVNNLHVSYDQGNKQIKVLDGVSFDIKEGEILALLGESGSGKSTIAKAIMGFLPPSANITSGMFNIDEDISKAFNDKTINWNSIRGKNIAMIFQDAHQALNPAYTIKKHFKETLLFHKIVSEDEVLSTSEKLLTMMNFNDVQRILDSYPFQLSGGMCQRVSIALSLCLKPKVLIADEPTSALDSRSQKEVLQLLRKVQKEMRLSVIFITHDIAVANAISNRVIILNKGIIEEQGDTKTVFLKPKGNYTRQLLASRNGLLKSLSKMKNIEKEESVLKIIDLQKSFHEKNILKNVNIELRKEEILGIIGESGCGKSTLARCITGLEKPTNGQVLYDNKDITNLSAGEKREICKRIQLVFQDARGSLNPRHTALQLVQEPLKYLHIAPKKEGEAMACYYLNEVGICGDVQNRRPPQLSTGQCQRIAIARALVLKPKILICDEAVSALDMSIQSQILLLLQRLHKQFGFSILMISHDIRVLRHFCQRIAIMKEGKFLEVIKANNLIYESKDYYTKLLLECELSI